MIKTNKKSRIALFNLRQIRDCTSVLLQIEDTQTKFTDGQKCYLCEVLDRCYFDFEPDIKDMIKEICKLNGEKRKLENKVSKLEKALKERENNA